MGFRWLCFSVLAAAALVSCGPSETAQTVSFVLDLQSEQLEEVEFAVRYSSGQFVGTTGSCVAGPGLKAGATEAGAVVVVPRARSRAERGEAAAIVRGALPTTTSTSTTMTSTTSTTTTTTTSTTSTSLQSAFTCTVTFRMTDGADIGALQFGTDYGAAPGFLLGEGEDVECNTLVADTFGQFNDDDAAETLDSGFISTNGFSGPVDVSECTFKATSVPAKSDFAITVDDATTVDLEPINPLPGVVVGSIECEAVATTTTLPPNSADCGDGTLDDGEECDDGNQVDGDGCDGQCRFEDSFESVVAPGELTIHIVHHDGIAPGSTLAFCRFQGDLDAANLRISVTSCDLSDPGACKPSRDVDVSVSTTTTTTTTTTSTTRTTTTTAGATTSTSLQ